MKRNYSVLALLGLVLICFSACKAPATEKVDLEKLKPQIQAMEDAFAAGEKAKNVDSVVAYYADDAVSHNRNEPPSVGMAAIREKIAKGFAKDTAGEYNEYKVMDLFAEGNSAVEIGSWIRKNANNEVMDNGYYMSYFQKRDGKYKCVRDMSVTETPVKPVQ